MKPKAPHRSSSAALFTSWQVPVLGGMLLSRHGSPCVTEPQQDSACTDFGVESEMKRKSGSIKIIGMCFAMIFFIDKKYCSRCYEIVIIDDREK